MDSRDKYYVNTLRKTSRHLCKEAATFHAGKLRAEHTKKALSSGKPASAKHERKAGQRGASLVQAGKWNVIYCLVSSSCTFAVLSVCSIAEPAFIRNLAPILSINAGLWNANWEAQLQCAWLSLSAQAMTSIALALSRCLIIAFAIHLSTNSVLPPLSAIAVCENQNYLAGTLGHRTCKTIPMESSLDTPLNWKSPCLACA